MANKDYDTTSVILARTIGAIRTNVDLMEAIAKYQKIENSFWDLIFNSLFDLVVIDSYKLIDKNNLSVFSLIKEAKGLVPSHVEELDNDYRELKKWINRPEFELIQHRHTRKAHHSKSNNSLLPMFADINEILEVLRKCELLIRKYNDWIKGSTYSIDFNSIYAEGHKNILDYVSRIVNYK